MTKTSKKIYDNWESSLQASCKYLSAEDADLLHTFVSKYTDFVRVVHPFYDQKDSDLRGWQLLLTSQHQLLENTNIPILTAEDFLQRAQVRLLFPFLPYKKPYALPNGHWIRIGQVFTGYGRDGFERGDLVMNTVDGMIAYCEKIPPSEWLDVYYKIADCVDLRNILPFQQLGNEVRFIPLINDLNLFLSLYEKQNSIGVIDDDSVPSGDTNTPLTNGLHQIYLAFSSSSIYKYFLLFWIGLILLGPAFILFNTLYVKYWGGDSTSPTPDWMKYHMVSALIIVPLILNLLWMNCARLPLETPLTRKKKQDKLYSYLIAKDLTRQYLESKTLTAKLRKAREDFWQILSAYDVLIHRMSMNNEQKALEILQKGRYHGGQYPEANRAMLQSLEQIAGMPVTESFNSDTHQWVNNMIKLLED